MEKHFPVSLTNLLITLNVIIFLLVFSLPEEKMRWAFETFSFSATHITEIWRWFTSLFLHVSASHLFFNMLGLYFFGRIVEEEVSPQWFLSIYFISGLIGSFAFMLTSPDAVVGASGCVFGMIGAAMLLNPMKRIHIYIFPLPLGIVALFFVIFEAIMVYFKPESLENVVSNVANVAHIGGVITGAIFAFFNNPKKALKGVGALILCVFLLIFFSPVFSFIALIGSIVLNVIDSLVGFFLYGTADALSFIWQ